MASCSPWLLTKNDPKQKSTLPLGIKARLHFLFTQVYSGLLCILEALTLVEQTKIGTLKIHSSVVLLNYSLKMAQNKNLHYLRDKGAFTLFVYASVFCTVVQFGSTNIGWTNQKEYFKYTPLWGKYMQKWDAATWWTHLSSMKEKKNIWGS